MRGSRHTPQVYKLGKRMLPTASNEAVPIIVLGLPSFVLPVLRLRKWSNTMLPSGETAIKQDQLPRLEVFELGPNIWQGPRVTWLAARKPANPVVLTQLVNQQQQLVDLAPILRWNNTSLMVPPVDPTWKQSPMSVTKYGNRGVWLCLFNLSSKSNSFVCCKK